MGKIMNGVVLMLGGVTMEKHLKQLGDTINLANKFEAISREVIETNTKLSALLELAAGEIHRLEKKLENKEEQ